MQDKDILKALRLMGDYTARQVDIILAPIERIKYPTKTELQRLVDKTISNDDFETLSLLNERFDLSSLDEEEIEYNLTDEDIQSAENSFVEIMCRVLPGWEMPILNNKDEEENDA